MPELPEVETTKNAILPFKGKTLQRVIVNNPSLRWPVDEKAINKINASKKRWDNGYTIIPIWGW